jgi:hypothetical protein
MLAKRRRRSKKPKVRLMLLETQLDKRLTSRRNQSRFMHEFLENFRGVELIAKEVHSKADLQKFFEHAKRDRSIRTVHLIAHGDRSRGRCSVVLTNNEVVNLADAGNRRLFQGLNKDVLFVSACQLGSDKSLMRRLLDISRAEAIFSYRYDVYDYEAFLIESMFYHLAYGYARGRPSNLSWEEVYERLRFAVGFLGVDDSQNALSDPLLHAEFRLRKGSS